MLDTVLSLMRQNQGLRDAFRDLLAITKSLLAEYHTIRDLLTQSITLCERATTRAENLQAWRDHHFSPLREGDFVIILYNHSLGRVERIHSWAPLHDIRGLDGSLYGNQLQTELLRVALTPEQIAALGTLSDPSCP